MKLLDVNPSEAAVERVLSALKKMINAFRKSLTPSAAICQVFVNALNDYNESADTPLKFGQVKLSTMSAILRTAAAQSMFTSQYSASSDKCSFCGKIDGVQDSDEEEDLFFSGEEEMLSVCCDFCSRWACKGSCDITQGKYINGLWKCNLCRDDCVMFRTAESIEAEKSKVKESKESAARLIAAKEARAVIDRQLDIDARKRTRSPTQPEVVPAKTFRSARLNALFSKKQLNNTQ
eukprot:GILI01034366.1.p1 GENE.GILI01034366.1~~GILI01034366.1.p1  ORF type:complete len:270 (+),score=31.02 GILI01034366.1:107-811(+)